MFDLTDWLFLGGTMRAKANAANRNFHLSIKI